MDTVSGYIPMSDQLADELRRFAAYHDADVAAIADLLAVEADRHTTE